MAEGGGEGGELQKILAGDVAPEENPFQHPAVIACDWVAFIAVSGDSIMRNVTSSALPNCSWAPAQTLAQHPCPHPPWARQAGGRSRGPSTSQSGVLGRGEREVGNPSCLLHAHYWLSRQAVTIVSQCALPVLLAEDPAPRSFLARQPSSSTG